MRLKRSYGYVVTPKNKSLMKKGISLRTDGIRIMNHLQLRPRRIHIYNSNSLGREEGNKKNLVSKSTSEILLKQKSQKKVLLSNQSFISKTNV